MKLSLYNIEQEYQELSSLLVDAGGELTPELEERLQINKDNLTVKAVNYGYVIKDLEAEVEAIDVEIKRLTALKKSRESAIGRLEIGIKGAMELYEIDEVKLGTIKINFRKSTAVEITDEALIPELFKEAVPATYKISKKDISDVLKAGETVPGARLVNNKNLKIS